MRPRYHLFEWIEETKEWRYGITCPQYIAQYMEEYDEFEYLAW